jgi:hypothetical protein
MSTPSRPGSGARVWIQPTSPRAILTAAEHDWLDGTGKPKTGVGIFVGRELVQRLTANQAITLADQIVDAAEAGTP